VHRRPSGRTRSRGRASARAITRRNPSTTSFSIVLAREPPDQPGQRVGSRRARWSSRARASSPPTGRANRFATKPKAVVLLEHHAVQPGPIPAPQQGGRQLDGVHRVETAGPVQGEGLARPCLGREQQQRAVGKREATEHPEAEPVGGQLRKAESEIEVLSLPQHMVAQRAGTLGDLVLERSIVERRFSVGRHAASQNSWPIE